MGIEDGNYVDSLNQFYPLSGDTKREGDDHLRLIKKVLVNSFPNVNGPVYIPKLGPVITDLTVSVERSDEGRHYLVSPPPAGTTVTLPAVGSVPSGWSVKFTKTVSTGLGAGPVIIKSLTAVSMNGPYEFVKREVPLFTTTVVCHGGGYYATRAFNLPVGTVFGMIIVGGYPRIPGALASDGSAYDTVEYPELFSALGVATLPNATVTYPSPQTALIVAE